jgi:hypothetical protein
MTRIRFYGLAFASQPGRARHPMRLLAQLVARGPMPFKGLKGPPAASSDDPAGLTLQTRADYFSPDRSFTTRAFCSGVTSPTTATTFLWVAAGSRYSMIRSIFSPSAMSCGMDNVSFTAARK